MHDTKIRLRNTGQTPPTCQTRLWLDWMTISGINEKLIIHLYKKFLGINFKNLCGIHPIKQIIITTFTFSWSDIWSSGAILVLDSFNSFKVGNTSLQRTVGKPFLVAVEGIFKRNVDFNFKFSTNFLYWRSSSLRVPLEYKFYISIMFYWQTVKVVLNIKALWLRFHNLHLNFLKSIKLIFFSAILLSGLVVLMA